MKESKSFLFVILVIILFTLITQFSLNVKFPFFLDIEKESQAREIEEFKSRESFLFIQLYNDANLPVLENYQHFSDYSIIATMLDSLKITSPFLYKLLNHSPPVSSSFIWNL